MRPLDTAAAQAMENMDAYQEYPHEAEHHEAGEKYLAIANDEPLTSFSEPCS